MIATATKSWEQRCYSNWISGSEMQLPAGLDSGCFLRPSAFSVVKALLLSTTRWVAGFWTSALDAWSWLVLWICLFSGVSPTTMPPDTLLCCVLIGKNQSKEWEQKHQDQLINRGNNCESVAFTPVMFGYWPRTLWCSGTLPVARSHAPPDSATVKHLLFWDSFLEQTLKRKHKIKKSAKLMQAERQKLEFGKVCRGTRVCCEVGRIAVPITRGIDGG